MPQPRPTFSIVTAVYNVEAYLPDFIRSIEGQTFGTSQIEVVAVDDGSTDASLALLEAWRERCPELVRIISQANAGQGAARNAGLAAATGTWVTFTDPDDMLDPAFFAVADAFADSHGSVKVMASKPLMFDEAHNRVRDRHARRGQYAAGNRVVDLSRYPVVFTGSSTVSIYRLDEIRRQGLVFDSRIRPTFEDGHFAARFVLGIGDPLIGVLRDARYLYRQRRSLNSTMQVAWEQPGRYSTIFDLGFLDLIERAKSAFGSVPAWLQNLLLYELSFYLIEDAAISSKVRLAPEMADAFHDRFAAVVRELDPGVVNDFTLRAFQPATVDLLLHGFRDDPWRSHGRRAHEGRHDDGAHAARVPLSRLGAERGDHASDGRAGEARVREDQTRHVLRPDDAPGAHRLDPESGPGDRAGGRRRAARRSSTRRVPKARQAAAIRPRRGQGAHRSGSGPDALGHATR